MKMQKNCFWKTALLGMVWMSLVLSAKAETITVNSLADTVGSATEVTLRWAINRVNEIGNLVNMHEIELTKLQGEIVLENDLPSFSVNVIVSGPANASVTINGASSYRIFSVLNGKVSFRNLTLSNAFAKGGKGGSGRRACAGGGGGGGMGAALFISRGSVECVNMTFVDNMVQGGAGGNNGVSSGSSYVGGGGGGGFAGDGGTFTGYTGGNGGGGGLLGGEGQGGRSATLSYAAKKWRFWRRRWWCE